MDVSFLLPKYFSSRIIDDIVAADFNGDGKIDVAITYYNEIYIQLGNGDGTFLNTGYSIPFGAYYWPHKLAAADFNNDGKIDLAVAVYLKDGPTYIKMYLGNGDGTFQAGTTLFELSYCSSLKAIDLNGDGNSDLIMLTGPSVMVSKGNGDGTFQPAEHYSVGWGIKMAVADFNGDGYFDLAIILGGSSTTISILLGNGDGTFQSAQNYPIGVGVFSRSIAAGDLNGDGKVDLVVGVANDMDWLTGSVVVLLGNGDGTFVFNDSYLIVQSPNDLALADFNNDGNLDIAVVNGANTDGVIVLLGKGDGTFQTAVFFQANSSSRLVVADFNGDGKVDMAVAGRGGAAVLLNDTPFIRLQIEQTVEPNPGIIECEMVYKLTISNTGLDPATEVILVYTLPPHVVVVASLWRCTVVNQVVTCELGTINAGDAVTIIMTVKPKQSGAITSSVKVTCTENSPVSAEFTNQVIAYTLSVNAWSITAWGLEGSRHAYSRARGRLKDCLQRVIGNRIILHLVGGWIATGVLVHLEDNIITLTDAGMM